MAFSAAGASRRKLRLLGRFRGEEAVDHILAGVPHLNRAYIKVDTFELVNPLIDLLLFAQLLFRCSS